MGELKGERITPRYIAQYCWDQGWRDKDLIIAVATCLSESQGYIEAVNDNVDKETGQIKSRDCGLFQINIPKNQVGTIMEDRLYEPEYNVYRAWKLYESRGFQPWYGYTLGYATSPKWWTYSEKYKEWRRTGRYIQRAVKGVANFYGNELEIATEPVGSPLLEFLKVPSKPLTPP
jgi:hypothetical protein